MNSINEYQLDQNIDNKYRVSGRRKSSKLSLKIILPLLLILLTAAAVTFFIVYQPTSPPRRANVTPPLTVAVEDVIAQEFQVNVQSYGTVAPRTQSFLVSQVSGVITDVSDNLREGSFFDKGDVLLRIDDRDNLADLKISEANLAEAQQALSEELAFSKQAEEDWRRLGNTEAPSDLVLRKPQQQAAQARLASAEAALSKAQLSVDRTKVVAPFNGRVLRQMVDVGQVASNNGQIAEVYATDSIEIRLPLKDSDLKFVDLPEAYRTEGGEQSLTPTKIFSSLTDSAEPWLGKVVRTESAIDINARQLHVVAQIEDPFGESAVGRTPLKIGEYVTAEIEGKLIPNAIVIPTTTIYQSTYVYAVEDNLLVRRDIDILWQDTTTALIGSGLAAGDRLVTTTLGQVSSGTRVAILGEAQPDTGRGGMGGMGGFNGMGGADSAQSADARGPQQDSTNNRPENTQTQGEGRRSE